MVETIPMKSRRREPVFSLGFLVYLLAVCLAVVAIVPPIIGNFGGVVYAAATPPTIMTVRVPGLATPDPITVVYDASGTPDIMAPTEIAGYAGLCWAMARDRLFQMDLLRRSAQGRLAEIFGVGPDDAVLQQDELMRTEGLSGLAMAHFLVGDARTKVDLTACALGINAAILADEAHHTLPAEFADLQYQPDPWQPQDSVLIGLFMASSLDTGVWSEKITRAATIAVAGPQAAAALIPPISASPSMFDRSGQLSALSQFTDTPITPKPATTATSSLAAAAPLTGPAAAAAQLWAPSSREGQVNDAAVARGLAALAQLTSPVASPASHWLGLPFSGGRESNNFVIGGELTARGMSLLANDPHLQLSMPSLLYLAQVDVPGQMDIEGLVVPGLPAFISGHNDAIAFGVTYAMLDDIDVYRETVRQAGNQQQVLYDRQWVPLQTRTETIAVAAGAPVRLTMRSTPHGPILNDALPSLDAFGPLAIKATFAQPQWTLDGFFALATARDWPAFRAAVARESIGLNFLYADHTGAHGHIGYQMAGLAPQRQSPANALVPVPGGDGSHEWTGFALPSQLPSDFDPPSHLLATANNRIVPDDYAPGGTLIYLSSVQWDEPWRAERAISLLLGMVQAGHRITAADVARVQLDTTTVVGRSIAIHLVAALNRAGLPRDDPSAIASFAALQTWDGNTQASSAGALIYEVLLALLTRDVAVPVLGSAYAGYAAGVFITTQEQACWQLLQSPQAPFFGATGPQDAASARDTAVRAALGETDALLRQTLGVDQTTWTWGALHELAYNHPLAAVDPRFSVGTFPTGGDPTTLTTGGWDTRIGLLALPPDQLAATGGVRTAFAQDALAAARVIWDLGDFDASQGVLSTGASGDPTSPHYADQAVQWRAGAYQVLPFTPGAVFATP